VIEHKKTAPAKIGSIKSSNGQTEFLMTIHEGQKRQIRLMLEYVGHKVISLKRIRQGTLQLGDLKTGQWRFLTEDEVSKLT